MLIGVTGNLGSGKTTVAKFFKQLGARIIDADKIVHQFYKKDSFIKKRLRREFGGKIFRGSDIDRKKLAGTAFATKESLDRLCNIIYPKAIRKIKKEASKRKKAVYVLDAPMLLEAGLGNFVDYIVVVKAKKKNQIKRSVALGFTRAEVLRRLSFQMRLAEKTRYADFVIDNNQSKRYTRVQVKKIWKILELEP